jgi:hypothetical protein
MGLIEMLSSAIAIQRHIVRVEEKCDLEMNACYPDASTLVGTATEFEKVYATLRGGEEVLILFTEYDTTFLS